MNEDLAKERSQTTFKVQELSEFLYGGQETFNAIKYLESLLDKDPDLDNSASYFLSDEEAYEDVLRQDVHFLKKRKEIKLDQFSVTVQNIVKKMMNPYYSHLGIHESMFKSIIKNHGTEKQVEKWLPLIENYQIIGTYAQTEMGHGTFVRGLETTATYDPRSQNFYLHSPTLTAAKWWPGALGHVVTHAVVLARLVTLGKDYGIHPFIVQLRSLEDHSVLPGRKLGSIGPKMSLNNIDNGYLLFNNVQIPRENMLMKYSQVSPEGLYRKKGGSEKLTYIAMVEVRANLAYYSAVGLAKACTIAIRYSAVRRQSKLDESKPELQVLDYKTQQYSLLPFLATSYAFWFTGVEIRKTLLQVQKEILMGNLSHTQELHATSAGLKSFTTQIAATGIETCRFRCGGHGYSLSSGLPRLYTDVGAPACTYEGENMVMMLQTARYLIKCYAKLTSGEALSSSTTLYLSAVTKNSACPATTSEDFKDPQTLIQAYKHRAARLVMFVSKKLQEKISSGLTPEDAWNNVSIDLVRAAKAYCHLYVVDHFAKTVEKEKFSAELRSVLKGLFNLYAVYGIVENAGDFLEDQYLNGQQMRLANDVLMELLEELRPNAVGLVDAFGFSDQSLNSVLGRYDGNVYEHLMKWAESCPMNRRETPPGYEKYLRPLLKGQITAKL